MTTTPLPAASPSVFTTYRRASVSRNASAACSLVGAEGAVARGRHAGRRRAPPSSTPSSLRAARRRAGTEREDARGRAPRRRRPRPADARARRPRGRRRGRRRARATAAGSAASTGKHSADRGDARVARRARTPRATDGDRCNAPHRARARARRTDDEDARHAQAARGSTTVWARAGPTPTKLTWHAGEVLDEAHVVARRGGRSSIARAPLDVAAPAGQRLVDRRAPCAAPTGGTARGRSACRRRPRRRRTP